MTRSCPVCNSTETKTFFQIQDIPIFCNILWKEREYAKNCPLGDIELIFCSNCSFIYNLAYNPERIEYGNEYENSLFFSEYFQTYTKSLAKQLLKRYNLKGKKILEIGCGKGDFLQLLCNLGNNYGVGFDPVCDEKTVNNRIKFFRDIYSEKYRNIIGDLIICRQTLEHIYNPKLFLEKLREAIGNRSVPVFFEVPNTSYILNQISVWDIIYEHYSYFTNLSLLFVFSSAGFHVDRIDERFGRQYLCVYSVANSNIKSVANCNVEEYRKIRDDISFFIENYQKKIEKYEVLLNLIRNEGKDAVVWGAGSKGVMFLNLLKETSSIKYAVDINPRKQGMYIPGTGQMIVSPKFLKKYSPETIILMNPLYYKEIQRTVLKLGLKSNIIPA